MSGGVAVFMWMMLVKNLLLLLACMGLGYCAGKIFVHKVTFLNSIEEGAVTVCAGSVFWAFLLLVLGFLGWLRIPVFFFVLAVLLGAYGVLIARKFPAERHLLSRVFRDLFGSPLGAVAALVLAGYVVMLVYLTWYPVTAWDALSYHLPIAREFARKGAITAMPFVRFPAGPQMIEVFFASLLWLGDPRIASILQLAMALSLAGLVYSFCVRHISQAAGAYAALAFLTSPLVLSLSTIPYVDMGAALFCFIAFFMQYVWITEQRARYAIASGVCWGIAMGCKYNAVLFFMVTFVSMLAVFNRRIRWAQALTLLAIAVAVSFPWAARNYASTGDWLFPLCVGKVRGAWAWEATDLASLMQQGNVGITKDIRSLCMLPFTMLMQSERFEGSLGLFALTGLGSIFFVKRWTRLTAFLVCVTAAYLSAWFYYFPVARYLAPVAPLVFILGGWTVHAAGVSCAKNKRLLTGLVVLVFVLGWRNAIAQARNRGPAPVTPEQISGYLARHLPSYRAISFLNTSVQKNAAVYALYDEGAVFYYDRTVVGDWFGPGAYKNVRRYLAHPTVLRALLKSYGCQYLVIRRDVKRISASTVYALLKGPFKIIYEDNAAFVLKLL